MHRNKITSHEDPSSIGWISTTDILLLVLVMSLAVALSWATTGSQLEVSSLDYKADLEKLNHENQFLKESLNSQQDLVATQAGDLLHLQQQIVEQTRNIHTLEAKLAGLTIGNELNRTVSNILSSRIRTDAARSDALAEAAQKYVTAMQQKMELERSVAQLIQARDSKQQQVDRLQNTLNAKESELIQAKRAYNKLYAENQKLELDHKELLQTLNGNRIARELLGLKGKLQRVVILLDTSTSMTNTFRDESSTGPAQSPNPFLEHLPKQQDRSRWEDIVQVVSVWLKLVPMKECVLITFDRDCVVYYPNLDNSMTLAGETEIELARRQRLIGMLNAIRIEENRGTRTRAALEKAYEFQPDTIILFTDGAPNTGNENRLVLDEALQIIAKAKPDIPINAIAVGDYFDKDIANFLRALATKTDGTFFGR